MILIHLKNNILHKRTLKTPFILFQKLKGFKSVKNTLKTSKLSSRVKLVGKVNSLITSKEKRVCHNVLSDGNTITASPYTHLKALSTTYNSSLFLRESLQSESFIRPLFEDTTLTNLYSNLYSFVNSSTFYRGSNGNYVTLRTLNPEKLKLTIVFPSGSLKDVPYFSLGTLGRSGGIYFRSRYLGVSDNSHKRPSTRGVAMNPVDHPNGGRTKTKKPFLNRYGRIAKYGK